MAKANYKTKYLYKGIRLCSKNVPKIIKNVMSQNIHWPYWAGWADGDGNFTKTNYLLRLTDHEPVIQLGKMFLSNVTLMQDEEEYYRKRTGNPNAKIKIRAIVALNGERGIYFAKHVAPYVVDKSNYMYRFLKNKKIHTKFSYLEFNEEEFIQWLTGFCEAEAHFQYNPLIFKYNIQIPNTNLTLMRYISGQLNKLNINHSYYQVKRDGQGPTFDGLNQVYDAKDADAIYISGQNAIPLLKRMIPYMLIKRKKQAAINIVNHTYRGRKN
jgi:hypothetical protein